MAQVVQAVCPGCKSVLRFPAEWMHQPLRCKGCGAVVQARGPSTLTPRPPSRPGRKAPPAQPHAVTPVPPTAPAITAARPSGSPFDFDAAAEDDSAPARRRRAARQGGGGWWKGPAIVVGVFVVACVVAAFNFPRIKQAMTSLAGPKRAENVDDLVGQKGGNPSEGDPDNPSNPEAGEGKGDAPKPAVAARGPYPRRALVISVHRYLFANPIQDHRAEKSANIPALLRALALGLNVPPGQIAHLTDGATRPGERPRPPLKPVIEKAITSYLEGSRKQDRVLLFFVGHTAVIKDKAYLAPVEGELEDAATLIPLEWVYQQLAKCPARQKVLVLDGHRYNPVQGAERLVSGPMPEKFDALLQKPPAGVQVWSACVVGQQSYETDDAPSGVFLDGLRKALQPPKGVKGAFEGTIQKHDDLIDLDRLNQAVNAVMKAELGRRKLTQLARASGAAPAKGAAFDPDEKAAPAPALPEAAVADPAVVRQVLAEVAVPPVKGGGDAFDMGALPPFPPDALKKYEDDLDAKAPLREAVRKARVALWAVSTTPAPADLQEEVEAARKELKVDLSVMRGQFNAPPAGAAEERFKNEVLVAELRKMAPIVLALETAVDDLKKAGKEHYKEAPRRWQANYDFVLARLEAQYVYVEEYQGALGLMRKELPPIDRGLHNGWRLAAKAKPSDGTAKKVARLATGRFKALADKHRGTPWEVLAKRDQHTSLGLEWQATR